MKLIIITGSNGYIGSHTTVEALLRGHYVIGIDRVKSPTITQRILNSVGATESVNTLGIENVDTKCANRFSFKLLNLNDLTALEHYLTYQALNEFDLTYLTSIKIIHCAGYKAVGESLEDPLKYYSNNLMSTINLLDVINRKVGIFGVLPVEEFVFSSSANVYGDNPDRTDEDRVYTPDDPDVGRYITNPYGRTKYFCEEIIKDFIKSRPSAVKRVRVLRYFNPIGYHPLGLLDEREDSTNVYARIKKCERTGETFKIFGHDYPTHDGTAIRDYIDISKVVDAHLVSKSPGPGVTVENIGTGTGMTVLELIKSVAPNLKYELCDRRPGDVGKCICSV